MINTDTPQFRMNLLIDLQKVNNAIDCIAFASEGFTDNKDTNTLIRMNLKIRGEAFRKHTMALLDGKLSANMQKVTLNHLRDEAVAVYQTIYKIQEALETDPEFSADDEAMANINAHRFAIGCIAKHYSK